MNTKTCSRCQKAKSLDDFGRDRNSRDGRKHTCRDCTNAMQRKTYARRQEGGQRGRPAPVVVPPHTHILIRYGDKEPVCFKCYFAERRVARNGRV